MKFAIHNIFTIICQLILGIRQVVRLRTLTPASGVRIPHSQPLLSNTKPDPRDLVLCLIGSRVRRVQNSSLPVRPRSGEAIKNQ